MTGSGEIVDRRHVIDVGSSQLELPIVPVGDDLAIALFMSIDAPISFVADAGRELASKLADLDADVVVTAATLGIPVGMAVAVGLGQDRLVVLQKTDKIHLADALTEPLDSITTGTPQLLRLDRAQIPNLAGKRVVFVDDVISSGSSAAAGLRLIRQAGGIVVGLGAVLVEGTNWKTALGDDADLVWSLDRIPLYRRTGEGWTEDWE